MSETIVKQRKSFFVRKLCAVFFFSRNFAGLKASPKTDTIDNGR